MRKIVIYSMVIGILAVVIGGAFLYLRIKLPFSETKNISINTINSENAGQLQEENVDVAQNAEKQTEKQVQQDDVTAQADPEKQENPQTAETDAADIQSGKNSGSDTKSSNSSLKIVSNLVSWGFQKSSSRSIKAIIIHTSYNNLGGDAFDFSKVMQEWKDANVSPHYAINRSGTIYQLVTDQNIAWHAGASKLPDGTTDVNGVSIGIEIVNDQDSKFTSAQYSSLNSLISNLKKKYPIRYVLGHDDIAPGRKTDPWGIEWDKVDK